jgi:TonB-linked SusC/RagA family outer membrane protein
MKKKPNPEIFFCLWKKRKILLTMKLLLCLFVLSMLDVSGSIYSQNATFNLAVTNKTVKEVFKDIESQSDFRFLYNDDFAGLSRVVSINAKDNNIEEVLNELLAGAHLTYRELDNDLIVITPSKLINQDYLNISGKVIDSVTEEPIPGVNVVLKGTTTGTVTDFDGNYSIVVPDQEAILVFSFISYMTREIIVGDQTIIDVAMEEQLTALDEIVVVGYGTQRRVNLTGSVTAMTDEKLANMPAPNIGTLLYGNLPGLITMQRSGEPGADGVSLNVRGFGGPLVVVDGIVGRDFSRLDPNEISSITVLKDAASTAVYGVSGGNGVILVETKRGTVGKPQFSYSMNYGVQTATQYPRFVNSAEFAELKNEASINIGGGYVYSKEEIEKFRDGTDPNYPNYDYYNHFVNDYAPQVQHNLSVRGGDETWKYFFLLGYTSQESMWQGGNQNYARYNFRSNVDVNIIDNLDISVEFGGRREDRSNLVQNAYLMASWMQYQWPIYEPYTPDGKVAFTNYGLSAYLDRDLTGYVDDWRYNLEGAITLNYSIPFIEGLNARVRGVSDLFFRNQKYWEKQYGLHMWDPDAQESYRVGARMVNQLQLHNWRNNRTTIQASLNYAKSFVDRHNVSALLLWEEYEIQGDDFGAQRIGYVVPIDQIFAGPDLNKHNWGGAFDDGRQSLVGRANYDFLGKYLFEYSFRYDGSARFPPETRWGFFSGISAGWRISEEQFFQDKFGFIENLKPRISYGTLGNDATGAFQFLTGYSFPWSNYILGGNNLTAGLVDRGIPNPYITWEKSSVINLGLDISLFNRMLEAEIDVFKRNREGLLATRALSLPSTFGASLPSENINSDITRGFEVVLGHHNRMGDFRYSLTSNFTYTKSRWNHHEEREFFSQYDRWRNGWSDRYKNRYMGLNAIGQFQSQEEINNAPIQDGRNNSTLRPGDIIYHDYNGDGVIDTRDYQSLQRGSTPEITYGLGINTSWRNFSMFMNWQGAANFFMQMQHFLIQPFANDMNTYAYFLDRWTREDPWDPDSNWVPGKYPTTINDGAANNKMWSDYWWRDASYLRLKVLNVGYTIQNQAISNMGVESFRVYLSGTNLLTISGLPYMDPETPHGRLSYYPQMKTYNLGVNLTF